MCFSSIFVTRGRKNRNIFKQFSFAAMASGCTLLDSEESVFLNFSGAQESSPRNRFRQPF
jgi:hypothetical protein